MDYYQDEVGQGKKKDLNKRRNKKEQTSHIQQAQSQVIQMKQYLKFLIELLERRLIPIEVMDGIYEQLRNKVRQHTFVTS